MSKKTNVLSYSTTYNIGKGWIISSIASASLVLALSGTIAYADTPTTPATESITADPQASTAIPDERLGQPSTPSASSVTGDAKKQSDLPQTEPQTPVPVESSESADTDHPDTLNPSTDSPAKSEFTTPSPSQQDTTPTSSQKVTPPTSPSQPSPQKPTATSPVVPLATPVKNVSIDTWMPNKTLQVMVANALHIDDVSKITTDNIKDLKELATAHQVGNTVFVDGQHEFSLKGLEFATNLTSLDLSYGSGEKGKLSKSPTGSGDLGDVIDLSPLSKLTKLTSLNVSGNKIVDLTPLKYLANLKNLDVTQNRIGDFSMLDAHQITSLKIGKQMVVLDYAQRKYVNSNTHSTTVDITPFLKLPQNYETSLTKPGLVSSNDFDHFEVEISQFHLGPN